MSRAEPRSTPGQINRELRRYGQARHIRPVVELQGRPGAEPEPEPGDIVIDRPRMSAFHGSPLDTILRNLDITHLILTWVHTNRSVNTTARVAADLGYTPILVSDATASTTAEAHTGDLRYRFADIATIHDTTTVTGALTA
ncbi:cysteine hydrolase family protein [Oerskovia flava]|uniref:cysteine hydrolase family protein n=1 Tax=Oerskovia flava TaxID=2986422 RepID=UPI00223ECD76|nr:isochorismatase family cysteine hydrolase [Oerskovia sp. JB1-3-2]